MAPGDVIRISAAARIRRTRSKHFVVRRVDETTVEAAEYLRPGVTGEQRTFPIDACIVDEGATRARKEAS